MTGAGGQDLEVRLSAVLDARPDLLPEGSRVLVAFSGGPDSTALLLLLSALHEARRLDLHAAHFDHRLRAGSGAVGDRCVETAGRLGVPCVIGSPSRPLAPSQAALREARYDFLAREGRRIGADRIAVGHQANDQAETVLFRIRRGTGLRGLRGIPARRGRIVRPLLDFRREDLAACARARGLDFEVDPANADPRWARVRIRREIEALEREGRDPVAALCRLARRAAEADGILDGLAADLLRRAVPEGTEAPALRLDRRVLLEAPASVRSRALRRLACAHGIALTRGGTRAGEEFIRWGRSGGAADLGRGLRLARAFDVIEVTVDPEAARARAGPVPTGSGQALRLDGPAGRGRARAADRTVAVSWGTGDPQRALAAAASGHVALHVAPGHFPLRLGPWQPGDRIRTAGGTRKLKKLFAEKRVPRGERVRRLVLADREGRVLWVEGVATADTAVLTPAANLWIEVDDV